MHFRPIELIAKTALPVCPLENRIHHLALILVFPILPVAIPYRPLGSKLSAVLTWSSVMGWIVSPKKVSWSCNPKHLRMWPYLKTESLQIWSLKQYRRRVGPNPVWLVSLYEDRDTQGKHHVTTEADWSDAATSQGKSRNNSYHQKTRKASTQSFRGSMALTIWLHISRL